MALHAKLIIIGSGPAGLTAAIYSARADLKPLVLAGAEPGGQLMLTSDVDNYPGFPNGIQGPDLMKVMRDQALRFGAEFVNEDATAVDLSKRPFSATAGGRAYTAESIIVATGASAQWLGLESETQFRGKGVSACATCDGFFFRGKDVAVVGGGDTAMEDATFVTRFARSVAIIIRKPEARASSYMLERARKNPKITFHYNTIVTDVLGDQTVNGLRLRNTETGEERTMAAQGVFIAIGHRPNTTIFQGQLDLDEQGYLQVTNLTHTSTKGVFACGDVQDHRYRQAVSAAGSGCMAALDAEKYLHAEA